MKQRFAITVTGVLLLAMTITSVVWLRDQASAQGLPELRQIIFQGSVTINGQPAPNGLQVTAKIRNAAGAIAYTSPPAIVGDSSSGRYVTLVVGPARDLEGRQIEFWLDDQVVSSNTAIFAPILGGQPCLGCGWSLPILRTQNLEFDRAPVATATPTPSPTPTIVVAQPSLYAGRVLAGSIIPPDGTALYARIGNYVSPFAEIREGRYQLVVNPVSEDYIGQTVLFFIGDFRAIQSATFAGGEFIENFNLVFSEIPPTPSPTPSPTATTEPTRTPTPSPSPTATATATVPPTQIPPTPGSENGGGSCNSTGGPASLGMVAFVMVPLGLLLLRKWRRAGFAGADDE